MNAPAARTTAKLMVETTDDHAQVALIVEGIVRGIHVEARDQQPVVVKPYRLCAVRAVRAYRRRHVFGVTLVRRAVRLAEPLRL